MISHTHTQGITLASAKAVSAGNSCKQEHISACANIGRKAVNDLLTACKSAAMNAENDDDKSKLLGAGRDCVNAFKALLELVHQIALKPTPEKKQKLAVFSKEVAAYVGEVVQAAEKMRG